jgi:FtsP/CotA-like multicopper oxidase with cupredoxin domain
MFLTLQAVDLLKAEESPIHLQPGAIRDLTDPSGRLVGVRAHDVEVEVDGFGPSAHAIKNKLRWAIAVDRPRWGINGPYPNNKPVTIKQGQQATMTFPNSSRMWHPMPLHCHNTYHAEAGMATTFDYII